MKEVWKVIPSFERYEISSVGRIKSIRYKGTNVSKLLTPALGADGYFKISLYNEDNLRKTLRINRLVLSAFKGDKNGFQAAHLNGNPIDNRLSNLKWTTSLENHGHKKDHGTHGEGIRNPRAKLTEKEVRVIRKLYTQGKLDGVQLAKKFKVNHVTIYGILNGRLWKHI